MRIHIDVPDSATLGDLATVQGALMNAASAFVDWELIREGRENAVSPPGGVLLDIARQFSPTALAAAAGESDVRAERDRYRAFIDDLVAGRFFGGGWADRIMNAAREAIR